jgi:uncharacterized protein YjiS (DUF1127 family)
MKSIQFAIASIVDANTGHGLPQNTREIDYQAVSHRAHVIRSRSFTHSLGRIGKAMVDGLKARYKSREQRRSINSLSRLNDHMLDDIGLVRGDIMAAQAGQISLAQLEAQRIIGKGNTRLHSRGTTGVALNLVTTSAANEALYAEVKCA